jgi:hypothetical protein
MEEVRRRRFFPLIICFKTACWQNLREEVAMDVDEEEEGDTAQRLKKVPDFGIEVDFDILSANEREVSALTEPVSIASFSYLWDGFDIYAGLP